MDQFNEEAMWELDTPLPDLSDSDIPYNWESEPLSTSSTSSDPSLFVPGAFQPSPCAGILAPAGTRSVAATDPQKSVLSNPSSPMSGSGSATSPSTSPCSSDRTVSRACSSSIAARTKLLQLVEFMPIAMGGRPGMFPGLSKPAFSPEGSGVCAFGTEEQCQHLRLKNRLFISQVDTEKKCVRCGLTGLLFTSVNLSEPVRDVTWVNGRTIAAALGRSLSLYRLNANMHIAPLVRLPWEHRDDVREFAVNLNTPCRLASGGFDKTVLVGNVEVLQAERVYAIQSVISSIAWCPQENEQLSVTTDDGTFRIFDLRTSGNNATMNFNHGKFDLYTHSYRNHNTVFFGFGDGTISIHDRRKEGPCQLLRDPLQEAIGELRFSPDMRACATFGRFHVSLWDTEDMDRGPILRSHTDDIDRSALANPMFKTSGDFVPNSAILTVTDSFGRIALYDI